MLQCTLLETAQTQRACVLMHAVSVTLRAAIRLKQDKLLEGRSPTWCPKIRHQSAEPIVPISMHDLHLLIDDIFSGRTTASTAALRLSVIQGCEHRIHFLHSVVDNMHTTTAFKRSSRVSHKCHTLHSPHSTPSLFRNPRQQATRSRRTCTRTHCHDENGEVATNSWIFKVEWGLASVAVHGVTSH